MVDQPYFLQRLGLVQGADERTIRRAYARELKLIDQETDPGSFQSLRESYDAALFWVRQSARIDMAGAKFDANGHVEATDDEAADVLMTDRTVENAEIPIHILPFRAREVFSEFQERCKTIPNERPATDDLPWQRELRNCLVDERLINIVARNTFERQVASLLADGWRLGHEALFVAAIKVFSWNIDRRRVIGLGSAGMQLDVAIDQCAMYDMQADSERERQRELIARLRDAKPPSRRELVRNSATLATLVARFPAWLAIITSGNNILRWRELDSGMPQWQRKLTFTGWRKASPQVFGTRRAGVNWTWLIFMAILAGSRLFINDGGSSKPVEQNVGQREESAIEFVNRGNKLMDAGDFDGAIDAYSEAITHDPNDAMAFSGRALALIWEGHDDTAAADLERAAHLDASNPAVYRGRGLLANRSGQYSVAIDDFTQSLKLVPQDAFSLYWRAIVFDRNKQQDKALADANEVIRLVPTYTAAYFLRARIFAARGEKLRVMEQADAVIAADPGDDEVYIAAAAMHQLVSDYKGAMVILDQGIAVKPTPALYTARESLYPRADIVNRRYDIMAALSLSPHFLNALHKRANLELDARKYNDAVAAFSADIAEKSLLSEEKAVLLAGRGIAYTKLGDRSNAESDFIAAEQTAYTSAGLNEVCWYLATRNVGLQYALKTCDAALVKNAKNAAAMDSKGFVLLRMARYRDAIASYDEALRLRPDFANSLFVRGIAKRRLGDLTGGDADLKAAEAAAPAILKQYADLGVVP
jgi:tetratricopeptide (TPR) repeat protein